MNYSGTLSLCRHRALLAAVSTLFLALLMGGCTPPGGSEQQRVTAEIYIQSPSSGTVTSMDSITVSGNASMSNAVYYPEGDVYWFNNTNGSSGVASSSVICIIGCLRSWEAAVPLAIGPNNITITFNAASASVSVTRTAGISGRITTDGVTGIGLIEVKAAPAGYGDFTDSGGYYTIGGLVAGNYTVTPISPAPVNGGDCLSFTPASRIVALDGTAILGGQDFIAAPLNPCYSISGHISPSNNPGGGYANVHVMTKDAAGAAGPYAYTDAQGNYTLYPFTSGTYTVIPELCVYSSCATFTPASRSITIINSNSSGNDFLLSW